MFQTDRIEWMGESCVHVEAYREIVEIDYSENCGKKRIVIYRKHEINLRMVVFLEAKFILVVELVIYRYLSS